MSSVNDKKNDQSRIAVSAFIVATTLTVMATSFPIPSVAIVPVTAILMGLLITALFAFLFILAKGYELRYSRKKENFIDKYNYILYNLAMTSYAIVAGVLLLGVAYKHLSEASNAGSWWGTAGVVLLFILVVVVINKNDIKDLWRFVVRAVKTKRSKKI